MSKGERHFDEFYPNSTIRINPEHIEISIRRLADLAIELNQGKTESLPEGVRGALLGHVMAINTLAVGDARQDAAAAIGEEPYLLSDAMRVACALSNVIRVTHDQTVAFAVTDIGLEMLWEGLPTLPGDGGDAIQP